MSESESMLMRHETRPPEGRGTLWDRWSTMLAGVTEWTPPHRRTVIISPHPDDETLSSGGLVVHQRRRGLDVIVVAVTDGDAAYDPAGDATLAARRRDEQTEALVSLGVREPVVRLSIPDGRVGDHEVDLSTTLRSILQPNDLVIAPSVNDHHPDHEATGRAAIAASSRVGCELMFNIFWTWHLTDPVAFGCAHSLRRLPLCEPTVEIKSAALAAHRSQFETAGNIAPILDERSTEPARWPDEYYLEPPDPRTRH